MGDIVQVLIIIGIIVFAVVKQIAGSSEKQEKQHPRANPPREDEEMEDPDYEKTSPTPFLSYEYDLYNSPPKTPKKSPPKTQTKETNAPPPIQEGADENPEFNIQSAEEVRRGIIWSEILNRKY